MSDPAWENSSALARISEALEQACVEDRRLRDATVIRQVEREAALVEILTARSVRG